LHRCRSDQRFPFTDISPYIWFVPYEQIMEVTIIATSQQRFIVFLWYCVTIIQTTLAAVQSLFRNQHPHAWMRTQRWAIDFPHFPFPAFNSMTRRCRTRSAILNRPTAFKYTSSMPQHHRQNDSRVPLLQGYRCRRRNRRDSVCCGMQKKGI